MTWLGMAIVLDDFCINKIAHATASYLFTQQFHWNPICIGLQSLQSINWSVVVQNKAGLVSELLILLTEQLHEYKIGEKGNQVISGFRKSENSTRPRTQRETEQR